MRDPEASIHFSETHVHRRLKHSPSAEHFLLSELASRLTHEGRLVRFRLEGDLEIAAERLPFVSHPYEWCDAQLHRAAEFTLALQRDSVDAGYDLKDASAWNVLFAGTQPIFCDLLSFSPLRDRRWWAMGQFARHFVLPLAISQRRGMHGHQSFLVWRDGVPGPVARQLLGSHRFFTRYWPLCAGGGAPDAGPSVHEGARSLEDVGRFRHGLHVALEWMLKGCKPADERATNGRGGWVHYAEERGHYVADSVSLKRACLNEWMRRLAPRWVLDLGCNTGEFSRMALAQGAKVVGVDADHDAVQRAYRDAPVSSDLHLVVAAVDDMAGGRGWAGIEHVGLAQRLEGRFDLVMMLALIHHLAISKSVPLEAIAAFAAQCTRQWLVVEFLEATDPQLQRLCAHHLRSPEDFSLTRQREAFLANGFQIETETPLAPAHRTLALLRRTA